jgi:hypothetical protein
MTRTISIFSGLTVVIYLSAFSALAQGKGQVQGRGPAVATGQNRVASSDHGPAKTTDHGSANTDSKDHNGSHEGEKLSKDQAIVDHITRNPELNDRIAKLLPPQMDLATAAMGFKNQGQFIAALHVAKNLNIPFDQLKAKMTGPGSESLGKAIHELLPTLPEKQVHIEAEKAEEQAKLTEKTTTKPTSD